MTNIGRLMQQAQEMQAKMAEMQERLADIEVSGGAGGGMVTATLNGKGELRRLKIDPSLAEPAEVEVLEDLVVAAVNDAKAKVEVHVAEEMRKITGGLDLPPGMKMPF
ncbi:MAG: YbaB/EbfC family nucleoid-associated protein [Proteobacteria bacterium]|nr:YbaB/EbfC family nucleoid-associated protein [Pseudomonadota bacterium]